MKILSTLVFCFSIYGFLVGQTIQKLELQFKKTVDLEQGLSIQIQLAERYMARDPEKAEQLIKNAFSLGQQLNNNQLLAEISFLHGKINLRRGDDKNAEKNFNSATRYAKETGDAELALQCIFQLLEIASKKQDYSKAYLQSKEAMALLEDLIDLNDNNFELDREANASNKKAALTRKESEAWENPGNLDSDALNKGLVSQKLSGRENELAQAQSEISQHRWKNKITLIIAFGTLIIILSLILLFRVSVKKSFDKLIAEKNNIIETERKRSDELLHHILPFSIAKEFKEYGRASTKQYKHATVLLADFKNFTKISELLSPEKLVQELDFCFRGFDHIVSNYEDIEKIKTIGDAYLCASGLTTRETLPNNLIKAALEMQDFLNEYKKEKIARNELYFESRIGIHTGPVVAGVVGLNKFAYDIWGDTLNTAARLEASCEEGKINISDDTYRLIRYDFDCVPSGKITLDKLGSIATYYVKQNGNQN